MAVISIALATYNGEKYIEEQIQSILNQTFQDFEIIIRDDCSTDNTYKKLCDIAKKDNRINVSRNSCNIGFVKNFEKIVNDCKGDFVAFSDQDDIWDSKHLEILLSIIGSNDLACGNSLLVDQDNNSLGITMKEVIGMNDEIRSENARWRLFYDNFVQGSAMIVRTELCKKYLPVPAVVGYHDYWLALVASVNNGIIYTSQIVLRYRQHGNNVTNNSKESLLRELYNAFNGFNKKHFQRQEKILQCLLNVVGNVPYVNESYIFYKDCECKKISKKDKNYFKEHYSDMFLTQKHYIIRKIIYLLL